jgi:hypothetical protein
MPRSVAGPNTSRVQQKMMKRTRSQTPPSAVSKAEVERRQKNPNLRDEQIDIERRTNKRAAERRQKDLARAGAKDLAAQRAGRKAGEAAGKRMTQAATKALTRGVPALGAALTGAEMLEDYVGSRAEADRAARRSYNERASTDMDTAARGVREAMSGDRMRRLQGEGMRKGGKVRGCGMAKKGVRPAKMM